MLSIAERLTPEIVEDLRELEQEIEVQEATEGLTVYQLEELEGRNLEIMEDVGRYPVRVWDKRFRGPLERWTATEMLLDKKAIARSYLIEGLELGWVNDQLQKKAKGEEASAGFGPTGGRRRMEAFERYFGAKLNGLPTEYARNFLAVDGEGTFRNDGKAEFRPGWREAWMKASEEAAIAPDIEAINVWLDGLSEADRRFFLQSHLNPKFDGLWIAPEVENQNLPWWNPSSDEALPRFVAEERPRVDAQVHDFVVKKTGYDIDRCQAPEEHHEILARANLSGYHVRRTKDGKMLSLGMSRRDLSKACLWKHFNLKEAVSNWIKQDLARIKQARQRKELWQPVFEAARALYAQARNCSKARQATDAEKIAAVAVLLFDTTTTLPKDRVMRWAGMTEMPKAVPTNGDLEKVKSAVFSAKKQVKEETWKLLDVIIKAFREAGASVAKRQVTGEEAIAAGVMLSFCDGGLPAVNIALWGGFDTPQEARRGLAGKFDPDELRKVVLTARKRLRDEYGRHSEESLLQGAQVLRNEAYF